MSDQPKDGGPAFPQSGGQHYTSAKGMTLRQYYAGQALVGLLAVDDSTPCVSQTPEGIEAERAEYVRSQAHIAACYADALIAELEKNP